MRGLDMSAASNSPAWLEPRNGERLLLEATFGIGRSSDNRLVLRDERVSRRHALIHMQGDGEWWLVDLGSSNGTYVNHGRVSQPIRLRNGDLVEFGPFALVFRQTEALAATETEITTERTVLDLRVMASWLLVADVEGYAALSHTVPVEDLAVMMGRWFSSCRQLVERHEGIINKYLGDGFFAYWPESASATARVLAAIDGLRQLQEVRAPAFRFVLHHGQVRMGGPASLGEESLWGDAVNFVFRMEKLAGRLGLTRLLSAPARQMLADTLPTADAGTYALAGFPGTSSFATF
jgi:adenylate cyclase